MNNDETTPTTGPLVGLGDTELSDEVIDDIYNATGSFNMSQSEMETDRSFELAGKLINWKAQVCRD
jgi:hypothetical protein